jgi:hypothetical protein
MRQREKLCRDAGTERGARPKAEENKRRLGENQNVPPEGLNRQRGNAAIAVVSQASCRK